MKAILLAGALLLAALTTKTYANDVKVTNTVQQSFYQNFMDAANVQWSQVDALYRADFNVDGEQIAAFFSKDGTLVATSRYITTKQLPRVLQNSLKTYTASFKILEIFSVEGDSGTDYYATVQNGSETQVLKAAAKKWDVYKKD